jgi:hypothetical protein
MARASHRPEIHVPHVTLNTDGQRHPRENALAVATVVLGVLTLAFAFAPSAHLVGSWTGLVGIVIGMVTQMISVTTAERVVIVLGLGASAVGFGLNMAHGGLY